MFNSVGEIMDANAAAGQHYFEPDTMRFFKSRVLGDLFGGRYFITSERNSGMMGDHPRMYTVREALPNGHIENASEFQAFSTAAQAKTFAKRLAEANLPFSEYDTVAWDKDGTERTGTVSHYAEVGGVLVVVVNHGIGKDHGPINMLPGMLEITHKHGATA